MSPNTFSTHVDFLVAKKALNFYNIEVFFNDYIY